MSVKIRLFIYISFCLATSHCETHFICHYNNSALSDGLYLYGQIDYQQKESTEPFSDIKLSKLALYHTTSNQDSVQTFIHDLYNSITATNYPRLNSAKFENNLIFENFPVSNLEIKLSALSYLIHKNCLLSNTIYADYTYNYSSIVNLFPFSQASDLRTFGFGLSENFSITHRIPHYIEDLDKKGSDSPRFNEYAKILESQLRKLTSLWRYDLKNISVKKSETFEKLYLLGIKQKREMLRIIEESLDGFIASLPTNLELTKEDWLTYKTTKRTTIDPAKTIAYYEGLIFESLQTQEFEDEDEQYIIVGANKKDKEINKKEAKEKEMMIEFDEIPNKDGLVISEGSNCFTFKDGYKIKGIKLKELFES